MEKKKEEMFYGLLTVKLVNPPASHDETFKAIKAALGLKDPQIDDDLGIVAQPMSPMMQQGLAPGEQMFVVGVESKTLWKMVEDKHPNVVGCMHALGYTGGHPPLHLKDDPASPKPFRGAPRNPKQGGPQM